MVAPANRNPALAANSFQDNRQQLTQEAAARQAERREEIEAREEANQARTQRAQEERDTARTENRTGRLLGRRVDVEA